MFAVLLFILYFSYMSAGISDSLLGSAWPVMYEALEVSVSAMGIVSMIIAIGVIVSNFFSCRLIEQFGFRKVLAGSFAMSAIALFGFSCSNSFMVVCISAIPYGVGSGINSAVLIKYVAQHFSLKYMNWLHCSWGIGATIGPILMGCIIGQKFGWKIGYGTVAFLHIVLLMLVVVSAPLWKQHEKSIEEQKIRKNVSILQSLHIRGTKSTYIVFFCYNTMESIAGLWASSYFVLCRNISAENASFLTSVFYLGIMMGRFFCGFVADKIGGRNLIRVGQTIILAGVILLLIPLEIGGLVGIAMIGAGCAPIYPCILQQTTEFFGKELASQIMSYQLISAYIASTFMPFVFGVIGENFGMGLYPFFLMTFLVLLILMNEQRNRIRQVRKEI